MKNQQIPLKERQKNIEEAIIDISRCDSPSNLNGVLAGALSFWKQKMRTNYMDKYPYEDDIYTVLLYTKHLTPGKVTAIKENFGDEITQTLHTIGYNRLMEQYQNELLEEFVQPSKEVA